MSNGHGASGSKTIFVLANQVYQTTAVPIGQRIPNSLAFELIQSGKATPVTQTYMDQFPWTKPQK